MEYSFHPNCSFSFYSFLWFSPCHVNPCSPLVPLKSTTRDFFLTSSLRFCEKKCPDLSSLIHFAHYWQVKTHFQQSTGWSSIGYLHLVISVRAATNLWIGRNGPRIPMDMHGDALPRLVQNSLPENPYVRIRCSRSLIYLLQNGFLPFTSGVSVQIRKSPWIKWTFPIGIFIWYTSNSERFV